MQQRRSRASGGSSSQTPSDASLCIRSAKPIARRKACALGASRNPSPCRKRQVSSVPLFVLSKLQTLRWFAIWFLYSALTRANFWPLRGLNALFGRRIAIFPIAYTSDKCTTRRRGQTASISVLLISEILGQSRSCTAPCRGRCGNRPLQTYPKPCLGGRFCPPFLILCTTGAYVGALLFPQQRVLPSSCVATSTDGSVVSTQAAL